MQTLQVYQTLQVLYSSEIHTFNLSQSSLRKLSIFWKKKNEIKSEP